MELREALSQISEIRQLMARSEAYRGYRSLTVGFSGVLALLGAVFQTQFVASPGSDLGSYLTEAKSLYERLKENVGENKLSEESQLIATVSRRWHESKQYLTRGN